ncbi:heterokaryon incompatibility protein-domain-containing protein [Xylariaceae sp. FL1019]|nr:heterokaryon incompatibility protein-domain-containing protein [Xylariaceae sp. FL1019]
MDEFQYSPLEDASKSIRVLTLLPGLRDNDIRIIIKHEMLPTSSNYDLRCKRLEHLYESLPLDWEVIETMDDRVLYFHREGEERHYTWNHPNLKVSCKKEGGPEARRRTSLPVYDAVSYAWGSPEKVDSAWVGNGGATYTLPLTANAASALRHLRYHDRPRELWIDIVCINQKDDKERSQQVQRMGEIFRLASAVVAWLGPGFQGCELAFEKLNSIGQGVHWGRDLEPIRWHAPPEIAPCSGIITSRAEVQTQDALRTLCERPYFRRLWVRPEIHSGNMKTYVQIGHVELSWTVFQSAWFSVQVY